AVGHDDPGQRELIQAALDAGCLEQMERLPHRMMDVASCLEWGGFQHPWPSLEELYGGSILRQVPSPLWLEEDGLYALTHVLLFRYGFGLRQVALAAEHRAALRRTLTQLLVRSCQDHHWDLLGELLLSWECVGLDATEISQRSWQAFFAAQSNDGAIPGPEWALGLHADQARDLDAAGRAEVYFSHHYHTTLVGILAACVRRQRLERPAAPPLALPSRYPPHGATRPGPAPAPSLPDGARRARRWLLAQLDTAAGPAAHADALHRILLGCALCDVLDDDGTDGALPIVAGRVAAALVAGCLEAGPPAAPALALLGAAILAAQGLFVPSLHGPEGLVSHVAALLATLPAQDLETELVLAEKRLLLDALGRHAVPVPADLSPALAFARALPLAAPAREVEALLLRIEAATAYGTRAAEIAAGDRWIGELLGGLAMRSLRQYDLNLACRTLRSMMYLGGDGGGSLADCSRFLCLHQRPEGAFGFFGIEERKLRATMPPGFSVDADLYLPVTVECLWTLAEKTGWRLHDGLRSRRRGAAPLPGALELQLSQA
ncbi:MAG TPA: hypothetical protein VOA87_18430, partial [Thermoanaerobaculia bacterium]|nr:hypothetical protein [Thermoanaerobaculia bacterium]